MKALFPQGAKNWSPGYLGVKQSEKYCRQWGVANNGRKLIGGEAKIIREEAKIIRECRDLCCLTISQKIGRGRKVKNQQQNWVESENSFSKRK